MAREAAFFDLDRTLLRGASGPILTAALREAGVLPDRSFPGESLVYKLYDVVGETLPGMALARRAATFAAGWSADAVVEAATEAAKVLTGRIQPYARQLMDEHRAAGRPVVLATTTPFDMVKPFADELGLDDVIATEYARSDEGLYTGGLAGDFVSQFLHELAHGAGLTLHVRLIDGEDTQHVLEAIFKALGVALAEACHSR